MRYSKWALLLFGAGMVFGLAVVSVPLPHLARAASLTMAAGLLLLPLAAITDWRRRTPARPVKRPTKPKGRRRAPARRSRAKARR